MNKLQQIDTYLAQAILLEVMTHPKPGLVTRFSNGAHDDMSILTFAMSSPIISTGFTEFVNLAVQHQGTTAELFTKVRLRGIHYEKKLLYATQGINTQRGILFVGGILATACGYLSQQQDFYSEEIFTIIKTLTKNLVEKELEELPKKNTLTIGEQLYHKYKITGIRGEVMSGLPSVRLHGLPALKFALNNNINLNDSLVHTLLTLISVTEDSNVVWRSSYTTLLEVQNMAKNCLRLGSIFSIQGKKEIQNLEKIFLAQRISPGGSADLLSITLALYLLEVGNFSSSKIFL